MLMASFTIQLHNLRFYAYHGLYAEEKTLGGEYEVNLSLKADAPESGPVSIEDTIDYAAAYEMVKNLFTEPEELLETICVKITNALKIKFPAAREINLQITKLHPPITAFTGSVSVSYVKTYPTGG